MLTRHANRVESGTFEEIAFFLRGVLEYQINILDTLTEMYDEVGTRSLKLVQDTDPRDDLSTRRAASPVGMNTTAALGHSKPVSPAIHLTPREQQVMHGLLQGSSNRMIARTLEISERTIKVHLKTIFSKLQVTSRTEAVVSALRLGIIDIRDALTGTGDPMSA
jgi:DNA-binding CsgD family transcriptional regulator